MRGWIIGLIVAVLVTALISILSAAGEHSGSCVGPDPAHLKCTVGHPYVPVGPGGEAVADTFYLVDHPMTGNGSITARLTSLAGATSTLGMSAGQPGNPLANTRPAVTPWAKAGLIIKQSLRQGAAYAAVMATGAHLRLSPRGWTAVIARGDVGVYEASGEYQLYVREMAPAATESCALAFEQLKAKLAAEGLFDEARKRRCHSCLAVSASSRH